MRHPFELDLSDLETFADLAEPKVADSQEAEKVRGGRKPLTKALFETGGGPILTTLAIGEEGGSPCLPGPIKPRPPICRPFPTKPPIATTQALGEEGGGCFPELY